MAQDIINAVRDCACTVWSPAPSEDESTSQRLYYFLKPEGLLRLVFIITCVLIISLCIPLYEQPSMIGFLVYAQISCALMSMYYLFSILLRVAGLLLRDLLYFKIDLLLEIVFTAFNIANIIVWLIYSVNLTHEYKQNTASGIATSGSRYDNISLTNFCFTATLIICSLYFSVLSSYVIIRKPIVLQKEYNN
ncbi:hypothetical protein LOD99_2691 [Oopsacas minuta]|uniref:MARVEL domain-containing protein n=1 Tax=Oopsacas minuta TaxID=111878 RepID=A0AAV7K0T3_9METZ|nr:hypothetical protein LOD99_2691 [Oopsacas minuta]